MSEARRPARRATYHHGDLVASLVREATAMVARDGHEALRVREVARAVGVSPAAPFRHFRDRDDLLRAVALEARLRNLRFVRESVAQVVDEPLVRFRALGAAQVRFAIRHPNLQRLLQIPSMRELPTTATDADREAVKELHRGAMSFVAAAQSKGSMRAGDPAVLALAGTALVHGLTQLFLEGVLPTEGGEELADAVIDVLGLGFAGENAPFDQAASRPTR